jgi:muramoyltetrapeptide carboxypeptidase
MLNILKPNALKPGDVIGIVATSYPFPFPEEESNGYFCEYRKGVGQLERFGFQTKESKNLRKKNWWCAGTALERAVDINEMFADPTVKAIIVHDGGESAIGILDYIDYELISKNPKPFIGFSDITNIHSALFTKIGLIGFHGPLLTYSFGRMWEQFLPDKVAEGKKILFKDLTSVQPLGRGNH